MGRTIKLANETYLVNDLYSSTEKRIGTWINGKPIYRKVVEYDRTKLNASWSHGIANISRFTNISGIANVGGDYKQIPTIYIENDNLYGRYSISLYSITTNSALIIAGSYFTDNINSVTIYLILEYTKTTD